MPVEFMGVVLDALQPGLVVATSTPRSEEAAIRAAVVRGIPTLTMVDLFAPDSDPFLRRPMQAQRITVIADEVRERFVSCGLAPNQAVVTGSPDFDELFERKAMQQGYALRAKLGWEGRKLTLWAGILEPDHKTLPGATGLLLPRRPSRQCPCTHCRCGARREQLQATGQAGLSLGRDLGVHQLRMGQQKPHGLRARARRSVRAAPARRGGQPLPAHGGHHVRGRDRIKLKLSLGEPCKENLYQLSTAELSNKGIERLTTSLPDALERSVVIFHGLGKAFVREFLKVKHAECDELLLNISPAEFRRCVDFL